MKKILVVPSNRESSFREFLAAWKGVGDWDEILLVEDGPVKTFDVQVDGHYSWSQIECLLAENSWIISRKDSAIRSFGFIMAVHRGATHVLTLDDDCFPVAGQPIFEGHLTAMQGCSRWTPSVPRTRTRGIPYRNLGRMRNVVASMGLWTNVPDLDSVQSLSRMDEGESPSFLPPEGLRIVPSGQFFPLCGMNFCFKAEVAPLCYFPLMGEYSPYRRFDDIWAGIIMKKILDHMGLAISVGEPFVEHRRASDPFANLVKEAPGIAANETFWETIDQHRLTAATPAGCMAELGLRVEDDRNPYIAQLGRAMQIWANLFITKGD